MLDHAARSSSTDATPSSAVSVGQRGPVAGAPVDGDDDAGQRSQAVHRAAVGERVIGGGDDHHAARIRERLGGEGRAHQRRQLAVGCRENADAATIPETVAAAPPRRWQDRAVDRRGRAWAASGAMELTGRSDGPALGGPPALVDLVELAARVVDRRSDGRVAVDGLALLGERAALGNLARQGTISCGGSTRLVRTADSWLAVSLARPDDIAALGAWLGADVPADDPWPAVERIAAESDAATLDERAALLGLPMAALSSVGPPASAAFGLPIGAACLHEAAGPARPIEGALVVDLSSLWAGPLCGQLLAAAGATVVKVESLARPDGARQGPAAFFDLMNGLKLSVALDLATPGGPVRPAATHRCGRRRHRERSSPGTRADGDHGGRGAGPPGRDPGRLPGVGVDHQPRPRAGPGRAGGVRRRGRGGRWPGGR